MPKSKRAVGLTETVWVQYPDTVIVPKSWKKPSTLAELRQVIDWAYREGRKVKAVGSGHSSSGAGVPVDVLLDTRELKRLLPTTGMEPKRASLESGQSLVRVEGGIKIKDLCKTLNKKGLALINMGNFDGQSIAGAICTGTHGSNLSLGPLAEQVVSIEIVTVAQTSKGVKAKLFRIEPKGGVTDPGSFPTSGTQELIQDDGAFHSSVVSFGALGVTYSLTLKVREAFKLLQERAVLTWASLKGGLPKRVETETPFYEFVVLPHKDNKTEEFLCLATRRQEIDAHSQKLKNASTNATDFLSDIEHFAKLLVFAGCNVALGTDDVGRYLSTHGDAVLGLYRSAFTAAAGQRLYQKSYKVFVLGYGDTILANSNEIAVPLNKASQAIEMIKTLASRWQERGIYHTAPVGVRFVGPSKHFLAMQYGRDTCMIETPMLVGSSNGLEILDEIERAMFDLGGRPHWGQRNHMARSRAEDIYPMFGAFRERYLRFNKYRVFMNEFTNALLGGVG